MMSKRRRTKATASAGFRKPQNSYDFEEQFDDSEDDFYAGREKILLEESPNVKRRRRIEDQEKDLQLSDDEVFEQKSGEDADDVDENEEEGDGESWGVSKADYYNADMIETEADALDEENEAKRIQQKQLGAMTEADFGFDETSWQQSKHRSTTGPVVEKLPDIKIPLNSGKAQLTDILYQRYPEFTLLAQDLAELQCLRTQMQAETSMANVHLAGVTTQTRLNALTSYLGALAMYFAVISTVEVQADESKITSLPPNILREHAVIDNLMKTKRLWDAVKDLEPLFLVDSKEKRKALKFDEGKEKPNVKIEKQNGTSPIREEREDNSHVVSSPEAEKSRKINLQAFLTQPLLPMDNVSEFGDEEPLTERQMLEKAKKKKSLRFYTSQIAQKANKRGAASRGAGGDDDVPHKERLRDQRESRLREAEKRGQQKPTAEEALGGDSDYEQAADENEYYQLLVSRSKQKQAEKQARTEAYTEAARQGAQVHEEEQIGTDGKRKITYAIEKNKGLAPKRRKDVRNPRVKKRKKFDEKVKKLGSIRQVYKGGEGRGGYGGELTGIKTNVVKSVKL